MRKVRIVCAVAMSISQMASVRMAEVLIFMLRLVILCFTPHSRIHLWVFLLVSIHYSCSSFTSQPSLPFIQSNSDRIIENANIRYALTERELPIILNYFRKPSASAQKLRHASLLLLQRSKAEVQLRYFEVLLYALEDPNPRLRSIATQIFVSQQQNSLWLRQLQYYPLFTWASAPIQNLRTTSTTSGSSVDLKDLEGFYSAIRRGLAERENEECKLSRVLVIAASLLEADLQPLQVRYLLAKYRNNFELLPHLALLFTRSHPLAFERRAGSSLPKRNTEELLQAFALLPLSRSAASTMENISTPDETESSGAKSYYLALARAGSAQKMLFLLSCQLLARDVVAKLDGLILDAAPAKLYQVRLALLTKQFYDLLQNAFYFLQDKNIQVGRKAAELLSNWPNLSSRAAIALSSPADAEEDKVSEYLMQKLEQLPELRPNELNLVFEVLNQRNASSISLQVLALYYSLDLAKERQNSYLQYFHRQDLSFAQVYVDYLSQSAALAKAVDITRPEPAASRKQLALFWRLEQSQQTEIVQLYFYREQELLPVYREFFAPFLLFSVQLELGDLLRSFFRRTAYDIYQAYDALRQAADGQILAQAEQVAQDDWQQLADWCYNMELLLQIVPDTLLYSFINWESLSYFEESAALELALRYIHLSQFGRDSDLIWANLDRAANDGSYREELARQRSEGQERITSELFNDRQAWAESLGETAQEQWFLNWFQVYLVIMFRAIVPGQWPPHREYGKDGTEVGGNELEKQLGQQNLEEQEQNLLISMEENRPNLPKTSQIWGKLLDLGKRHAPRIAKAIQSFAELVRDYRLWQAWVEYFGQQYSGGLAIYDDYVRAVLVLNEEEDRLQLQIQRAFLQPSAAANDLLLFQRQLLEVRQQKQEQLQNFMQRKAKQQADQMAQARAVWQEFFDQTKALSEKWQFVSNREKIWLLYFFPEFDVLGLEKLVRLLRQNDLLR